MNAQFVHLHVHTEYSLLDGAIRLDNLLAKCKEFGLPAVAITDHGVMHGVLEFYEKVSGPLRRPFKGVASRMGNHLPCME